MLCSTSDEKAENHLHWYAPDEPTGERSAQWKRIVTILCIASSLRSTLELFSPVSTKVLWWIFLELPTEPVTTVKHEDDVFGCDHVAVTPHFYDSTFSESNHRDLCRGLWSVDVSHQSRHRRFRQGSAQAHRLWSKTSRTLWGRTCSDCRGRSHHRIWRCCLKWHWNGFNDTCSGEILLFFPCSVLKVVRY